MKQQEIKVFLAIAKYRSISAAAAALHYAQPTVSAYLNQLEQSLGVQLVMRAKGKREVELTPAEWTFSIWPGSMRNWMIALPGSSKSISAGLFG